VDLAVDVAEALRMLVAQRQQALELAPRVRRLHHARAARLAPGRDALAWLPALARGLRRRFRFARGSGLRLGLRPRRSRRLHRRPHVVLKSCTTGPPRLFRFTTSGEKPQPPTVGRTAYEP
jgi:hypothetical protein